MKTQQRHAMTRMAVSFFVLLVMLFPVYWIFATSLKSNAELAQTIPTLFPIHPDWQVYQTYVFHDPDLVHYLWNSLQIGTGTLALSMLLGVPLAYALARLPIKGKRGILLFLLVMQMFPSIMLATPLFIFFVHLHLINNLLAVILATTTRTLPFGVLVLRPFFLTLPPQLEEAAAVDGANLWVAFVRIILPPARAGVVTVGALTFLLGWSEFLFSLILLTDDSKRPLTLGLYKYITNYGTNWNGLMAVAVVAAVPVLLVFIFAQRYITSGLTAGSVNE
ncbi:MAG TPA: carbohydrate ABC transporter permease [Ktedonobacteraceae bacterium]|nr:carbohydrate ABC transporter permease [Ktedonobacteraceae bacterium]